MNPASPDAVGLESPLSSRPVSVLFVCLGNICRSPLAEGVFLGLIREKGLESRIRVDSAGTGGWHVGEPADPRMSAVAWENGVELESRARQVDPSDLERFDWVIAMDGDNLRNLRRLHRGREVHARVHRLLDFHPEAPDVPGATDGVDVPDPYYGGSDGFRTVYRLVREGCEGLLEAIRSDE